jgi:hypothetical protein
VINITLDVHVDATKIPQLLSALSRNRLVTVRNVSFSRVDNTDMLQQNFVYGNNPVADLTLDIEMLQMREWTVPYMPPSIRALVGATQWNSELAPTTGVPAPAPATIAKPAPVVPTGRFGR